MAAAAAGAAAPLLLLALAAVVSAQSPTPPPLLASTCYSEYQSVFHWLDSSKSTEYSYDLRSLCGVDRWFAYPIPNTSPSRYWGFYFALGGNISRQTFTCAPTWTPYYFSGGSFIQSYDIDRPVPTAPPGWPGKDPETGAALSGPSYPCIVFAHTRPEWDVLDATNPATGGIRLAYLGLTEPASDSFNSCPYSDVYSGERPRKLTINLLCDPAGSTSDVKYVANPATPGDPTTYFAEVDTCVYELTLSTKAACGSAGDPFDPSPCGASTAAMQQQLQAGLPGTNFGFTVLGMCLLAVAQYAIAKGALDVATTALQRAGVLKGGVGFGRGGGGGVGGGATSSASASAPSSSAESAPLASKSYGAL